MAEPLVEELLPHLTDHDKNLRRETCHTLGKIGSPKACDALRRACRDAEERVRARAVEALGRIGETSDLVIDELVLALSDEKPRVRREAVTALTRLGDGRDSVLNALREREQDSDSKVRTLAKRASKTLKPE